MAMLKLALSISAGAALAAGIAALPTAAAAQSTPRGEIIVYGDDPCPRSADDEVVVCRRRPAEERYRIPEAYRPSGTRQQSQSWSQKARALVTAGATGVNSCSAVGPGGHVGCVLQKNEEWAAEKEEAETQATAPSK
ncbi:MAG: hypothetical protein ABIQ32_10515 [Sphingomicrobium sp.]